MLRAAGEVVSRQPASGSRRLLGVLFSATLLAAPIAALEVPYLSGRVMDSAELLSPEVERELEEVSRGLEEATGAQLVVLTIPSLEGEPLEDYSLRVAETWELGRAGADDGILLLVSRDDREVRIEVGYGLEGAIPDAACRRVIDRLVVPRFKQGDFDGGVEAAVEALAGAAKGDASALPAARSAPSFSSLRVTIEEWVARLVGCGLAAFVLGFFGLLAIRLKGFAGWFLTCFLSLFFGGLAQGLMNRWAWVVVVAWLIVAFALRRRWATWESSGGGGSGGGWSSGGWSSGGGSFSGGGSSFSGGGGSFGGGGASGSW